MGRPVTRNECFSLELSGGGEPQTVRDLDALVRQHGPKLVFLCETMISEGRVKNLRWRLGLKGCLAVDSRG
jgi:hypothetical protein